MKILLLEDDEFICEQVKNYFELDGHDVDFFNDGEELLDNAVLDIYDIFLFDINTPKKDGFETLTYIRQKGISTPAMFLTAMSDIEHVKKGYDIGCSDYIRKPFILEEVELRINQILYPNNNMKVKISHEYEFDLSNMRLFYKEIEVAVNKHERALLYILVKNLGNIVTPYVIKDYVWEDKDVCDNTLRTQIKKLRAKLKENFIINIRNSGYKIEKNA